MSAARRSLPGAVGCRSEYTASPDPRAGPRAPAIERLTIEHAAMIAASMALRPQDRLAIRGDSELDPDEWEQVAQHWTAAIGQEARRGKVALLLRYDRAYVSRFEEERGPITVDRYVRLAVAVERGTVDAVMRLLLALPKSILMRIERVWNDRMRADRALSRATQQALSAARRAEAQ
ncbi:MAG: hypothetical protein R3B70_41180 [Polyangiaceae bacterium]